MNFTRTKQIYKSFILSYAFIAQERLLFVVFLGLSLIAAVTEGIGVSMLAPILDGQNDSSSFSDVPFFKLVSSFFLGMEINEKMQMIALILGSIMLVRGVLLYFVQLVSGLMPLKIQRKSYQRAYNALLDAEYSYFTEKTVGEHTNSLNDWTRRSTAMLRAFGTVIFNAILLFIYLGMMIVVSWKLAILVTVFITLLLFVLKKITSGAMRKAGKELTYKTAGVSEMTYETIAGMKFIKTSSAEQTLKLKFRKKLEGQIAASVNMVVYQSFPHPFMSTSAGIFICSLLFFGSILNTGSAEWVAGLMLFLILLMRLVAPVSQISASLTVIAGHFPALEGLDNYFKETALRKQPSGNEPLDGIEENIDLVGVSFRYPGSDTPTIRNMTLRVPAKKMIAVVGPSGSGKTTLVSLLTRFYDPEKGKISIDGKDLKDFDVHSLHKKISVVSQDIFIFNDTVSNNLSFSLDNVSQADIVRACKLAAADEFIREMPEGYDTMLGDRGVRLSGGQQQRIAIARAILRNPDLLIFDEATSHLDTFTEQSIQDAVEELREGRTLLVIAHRLSTIRRADVVVVVKDGEVVEQGSHNELMAAQNFYWDMVNHQNLDLVNYEE